MATETRAVADFDRVVIRDYGEVVISQGEQESLTIEADQDILPQIRTEVRDGRLVIRIGGTWFDKLIHALSTSFSRRWIKYTLSVKKLSSLSSYGAVSVKASRIEADQLSLRLGGVGEINLADLSANRLKVALPGAGAIKVSGQVQEQIVNIRGTGSYSARQLQSQRTRVDLQGAASATVWATEDLDVSLRGVGSVEYYGNPTVKKNISGLGSLTHKGAP